MRIPKTDNIFGGFDLDQKFESKLPNGEFFKAGQIDTFFADLLRGDASMLVLRQTENFANIAKHSFGGTAINQGILPPQYQALAQLFDSTVTLADVRVALRTAGKILSGLMELGQSVQALGSAVPIAGWVINLAAGVVRYIQMIVRAFKAKNAEQSAPGHAALAYDRDNDSEITQGILDEGRTSDWTRIFLPTRTGTWTTRPAIFTPTGQADGVFIDQGEYLAQNLGWGIPPLLTSQLGPYQYPETLPGSNRLAGHESLAGYTELHPSAVQTGLLFSQRILALSAEQFWVDPNEIVSRWKDYFAGARELQARTDNDQLKLQLSYITSFVGPFGWQRFGKYDTNNVPGRFHDDHGEGWLGMEGLIEYIMFETWWSRAMVTLGTPIVAYIAPNAPALRASGRLAELHRDRRILLLRHPRRWDVDLDSIPDAAYRSAMGEATMKIGEAGGLRLRTDPKPKLDFDPILASIVPDALPPPPEGDAEPAIPANLAPEKSGSAGLVAVVAVALGLLAVRKH